MVFDIQLKSEKPLDLYCGLHSGSFIVNVPCIILSCFGLCYTIPFRKHKRWGDIKFPVSQSLQTVVYRMLNITTTMEMAKYILCNCAILHLFL